MYLLRRQMTPTLFVEAICLTLMRWPLDTLGIRCPEIIHRWNESLLKRLPQLDVVLDDTGVSDCDVTIDVIKPSIIPVKVTDKSSGDVVFEFTLLQSTVLQAFRFKACSEGNQLTYAVLPEQKAPHYDLRLRKNQQGEWQLTLAGKHLRFRTTDEWHM